MTTAAHVTTASLVRSLVEAQHPELASSTLEPVDEGWDNATFRLGTALAVRLPRRKLAAELVLNEQRWLPVVAPWLSLRVPVPVAVGVPSESYPWPWSIVPWVPGVTAGLTPLTPEQSLVLAENLRALHRPTPPEAPRNPFRGVPLEARREAVEDRLSRLGLEALLPAWRTALEAGACTTSVWLHGDLHSRNVILRDGALSGLIDWGDITAGDPATDLACAWTLMEADARAVFWETYGADEDERARAAGWAVNLATAMVDAGDTRHRRIGRAVIERLSG